MRRKVFFFFFGLYCKLNYKQKEKDERKETDGNKKKINKRNYKGYRFCNSENIYRMQIFV